MEFTKDQSYRDKLKVGSLYRCWRRSRINTSDYFRTISCKKSMLLKALNTSLKTDLLLKRV